MWFCVANIVKMGRSTYMEVWLMRGLIIGGYESSAWMWSVVGCRG